MERITAAKKAASEREIFGREKGIYCILRDKRRLKTRTDGQAKSARKISFETWITAIVVLHSCFECDHHNVRTGFTNRSSASDPPDMRVCGCFRYQYRPPYFFLVTYKEPSGKHRRK